VARSASAPHAGEDGPRYPGTCREAPSHPERLSTASIRLRVEPGEVAFTDLVAGPQAFDVGTTVGDFVIRRADGVAAYQLAVAYDDSDLGMTRVVRGGDLLASTSRQLLVYRALGLVPPAFAHVPLMMGEDGHRLAKRGGALSVAELRAKGVTPERLVGFLSRTAGIGDGAPVSARALVDGFALDRIARAPAVVTTRDIEALIG
jgi:glutamyl-tRNA synthetase